MGLIDVLTQYDTKKKAAHAAKTVKHGVSRPSRGPGAEEDHKPVFISCCLGLSPLCRLELRSPQSIQNNTPSGFANSSQTSLHNVL